MNGKEDKPPSTENIIRYPTSIRVYSGSSDRGVTGARELAILRHLSTPMFKSRLRDDSIVLAFNGQD